MPSAAYLSKEQGNDAFKCQKYDLARGYYTDAMLLDPSEHLYPLNNSMANLKLERWSEAEKDATTALALAPKNSKAYYRRGVARRRQANYLGARQDIQAFINLGGDRTCAEEETAKIDVAELSTSKYTTSERPRDCPTIVGDTAQLDVISVPLGFAVKESAGKNLGAFATQAFHRGDLVLADPPLYVIDSRDNGDIMHRNNIIAAAGRLSQADMEQFLSLKNSHVVASPILGIHATNSFSVGSDDENLSAICVLASRFNHACSPNARYSWHAPTRRLRIYALCEIAIGEEILVTYISGRHVYGSCRNDRQKQLKVYYGFICACAVCILPSPEVDISDRRRRTITEIWDSVPMYNPRQTAARLQAIARALRLLQEEGYAADMDDFTNDAAAICAAHSDWESAEYWARKTYETRVAEFGEDSQRAAEVRPMWLDPRKSPYAGKSIKQKFSVRL